MTPAKLFEFFQTAASATYALQDTHDPMFFALDTDFTITGMAQFKDCRSMEHVFNCCLQAAQRMLATAHAYIVLTEQWSAPLEVKGKAITSAAEHPDRVELLDAFGYTRAGEVLRASWRIERCPGGKVISLKRRKDEASLSVGPGAVNFFREVPCHN